MTAEQQSLLSVILECAGEAIVLTDGSGIIQYVNPAFEEQTGYRLEEVLGKRPSILKSGQHDENFYRRLWQTLMDGKIWRGRIVNRRKDGALYTADETISPVRDVHGKNRHFISIERDVTEQLQAENSLRESERRYRLLAENTADIILTIAYDLTISFASPSLQRVSGIPPERVLQCPLDHLFGAASSRRLASTIETLLVCEEQGVSSETHAVTLDAELLTSGCTPLWTEAALSCMRDEHGNCTGVLAVLRETTERRRLEEELRQSQKMEAVGQLAGGVAHDFNNILTAIQGYTELLSESDTISEHDREMVGEVGDAANRATGLTRQLLAFGRKQELQPEHVDVNHAVVQMSGMLRRLLGELIELETHLGADLPIVYMDKVQLEQVLLNLAVNARDAMPEGGGLTIASSLRAIPAHIRAGEAEASPGRYVVLSVSDTGVGMDEETKARIFEPFFTTKRLGHGTGLGLSTIYGIIKQSGGHICVESTLGKGTRFEVYFPAAMGGAVPTPIEGPRERPGEGNETLLFIEDDDALRTVLERSLRAKGYRVIAASNCIEAMSCAERHGSIVDLIVCDVILPRMQAPELIGILREYIPNAPVIYISGYTGGALDQLREDGTPYAFLQKPFSNNDLCTTIRELLAQSPVEAGTLKANDLNRKMSCHE